MQDAFQRGTFVTPERFLTEHFDHLAEGHSAALFDNAIKLDERRAEPLGKQRAKRRLASTAQPDERDAIAPHRARRPAETFE